MIILHINELFCGFEELNESVCRGRGSQRVKEKETVERKKSILYDMHDIQYTILISAAS